MKQIIVDNQVTQYSITENGKCYNNNTGKYLKGQISNSGYLNYNLTLPDGTKKRLYAHRLVAIAYIPNIENKPEVNHKDGNKLNNNVDNLEWMTASENQLYNTEINNKSTLKEVYQFDKDKNLVAHYNGISQASRETDVQLTMISQEINKDVKTLTAGYYWSNSSDNNFKTNYFPNTGKAKRVGMYDIKTGELLKIFNSTGEAGRWLGVKRPSHIGECCRGKIKTYKGYIWKYIDEDIV